jgi:hypothetical protein
LDIQLLAYLKLHVTENLPMVSRCEVLWCLVGVVMGSLGIVLRHFGVVDQSNLKCGVIFWSFGDVVLMGLGVVTGRCVCCRAVRRQRCALVTSIPRRTRYSSGLSSHQRYITQQQHDATVY